MSTYGYALYYQHHSGTYWVEQGEEEKEHKTVDQGGNERMESVRVCGQV